MEDLQIIEHQPTLNIGTLGHVAHGKSTLVKALSGVHTPRHRKEQVQNITIHLGYANAKIFKCLNPECKPPGCYHSTGSAKATEKLLCKQCQGDMQLVRHISFVDCPGHEVLMATMLNGTAVMDAALLVIAANSVCPQPQTQEHLAAAEILQLKNIIIVQNKVDLVTTEEAQAQFKSIKSFVEGTVAARSPVIPVFSQLGLNIDAVCQYIVEKIPMPLRDVSSFPRFVVIRSFDVNKPGTTIDDLKGGVAGGTLSRGTLKVGDKVEFRPGIVITENRKVQCTPIITIITSLFSELNQLQQAWPGGLIGVGTTMDPVLTKADRLVGQVMGALGKLPPIFVRLTLHFHLIKRLVGVNDNNENDQSKSAPIQVTKLQEKETIKVNIGSASIESKILKVEGSKATIQLTKPVCVEIGERVALSRRFEKHWRLIGFAQVHKNSVPLME